MLDEDIELKRGDLYPEDMLLPTAELVQERRFLVAYNHEFAIFINKADHGPPHVHIVKRQNKPEIEESNSASNKCSSSPSPREARFLIIDDLINGVRLEPFPYTDPQSRRNGSAAENYPERTVDGKNAKRKYSMTAIEREKARHFGNKHAQACLSEWSRHIQPHLLAYPDASKTLDHTLTKLEQIKTGSIPITDKTIQRFLEPWDNHYEHPSCASQAPSR